MTEIHGKKLYRKKRLEWRLALFGLLVGLASGIIAVCYRLFLTKVDSLRTSVLLSATFWQSVGILLALLFFAFCMHRLLLWAPYSGGSGIPQIRAELLGKIDMAVEPTIVSKFIGGILGNAGGLTLGREGPSIQLGGMLAKKASRLLDVSEMEERYLVTAGAAAGLAAAFNAPLSGALFAMEEIHKSLSHLFLIPCLAACLMANYFSFSVLGVQSAFAFGIHATLPVTALGFIVAMGVLSGLVGVVFNRGLLFANRALPKLPIPRYLVIFLIMAVLFFVGRQEPLLLGGGHALIEDLAKGAFSLAPIFVFLLLRLLFVWASYGSGAQGHFPARFGSRRSDWCSLFLPRQRMDCIGILHEFPLSRHGWRPHRRGAGAAHVHHAGHGDEWLHQHHASHERMRHHRIFGCQNLSYRSDL